MFAITATAMDVDRGWSSLRLLPLWRWECVAPRRTGVEALAEVPTSTLVLVPTPVMLTSTASDAACSLPLLFSTATGSGCAGRGRRRSLATSVSSELASRHRLNTLTRTMTANTRVNMYVTIKKTRSMVVASSNSPFSRNAKETMEASENSNRKNSVKCPQAAHVHVCNTVVNTPLQQYDVTAAGTHVLAIALESLAERYLIRGRTQLALPHVRMAKSATTQPHAAIHASCHLQVVLMRACFNPTLQAVLMDSRHRSCAPARTHQRTLRLAYLRQAGSTTHNAEGETHNVM